ncbi:tetratricopeptide repeat-containing diguanylate cyclase [Deinococcus fonticola]|uniref:tetratricopeptide repeat-containing diguanylate cyclase n=1 Tax=Deinococcus fonticola TaxID=2528713 RepID=UPI0010752680|nr:tetratricopeptide repeat-containing diguanylate cyclase [Deinococcus fonticola]
MTQRPPSEPKVGTTQADLDVQLARAEDLVVVDPKAAEQLTREVIARAQEAGEALRAGQAGVFLGATLFYQAQYDEAYRAFHEALSIAQGEGDRSLEARALNGLGNVVSHQGDYAGALEYFMQSSHLALETGDELGRVRVLNNIAALRSELGEHSSALAAHQEVVAVAGQMGDRILSLVASVNVLVDLCNLGNHDRVLTLADELVPNLQESEAHQPLVVAQAHRANSLRETGQLEAARRVVLETLPVAEDIGEQMHLCYLMNVLTMTYQQQGQYAQALPAAERALNLAQTYGIRTQERDALGLLCEIQEALGDFQGALAFLRAHYQLERELHAENVDRKTRFITAQFELETLRREAEQERERRQQLLKDHSALREDHALLSHLAAHDPLTGLANRPHFQERAAEALKHAGESCVGLLFLDLDGFKAVNDTLGHDAGDDLLRQVASRLRAQLRREDVIARPGGDEFTVLLPHLSSPDDAQRVARKLLRALTEPFTVYGQTVHISASVGSAVAPHDGLSFTELNRCADEAMYRVKRQRAATKLPAPT